MKYDLRTLTTIRHLSALALGFCLALPLPTPAAPIALAKAPLANTTTSSVRPNVMFILDNSGSMDWEHMPDDDSDAGSDVPFQYGYYGLRSSQCNQVYYDPNTTYLPPVTSAGVPYTDASFTNARTNGYSTASCTSSTCINLNTGFKASSDMNGDTLGQSAYYYSYSGSQLSQQQKNYNSTTNTFYSECHNSTGSSVSAIAPTSGVGGIFTKVRYASTETTTITVSGSSSTSVSSITVGSSGNLLNAAVGATTSSSTLAANIATQIHAKTATTGYDASAASGTVTITGPATAANYVPVITQSGGMTLTADVFPDTTAAKLTNFANWYSFYRSRLLMMKTAAGRAFKTLDNHYRVGFTKISSSATPTIYVDTFEGAQRTDWYTALYGASTSGSTPLREALANAGRYYAGKLSGADPLQYSCQQNFTILSTDGFWNGNAGFKEDGSADVGNTDGPTSRPTYDGASSASIDTTPYTRDNYSASGTGCSGSKKKLKTQPEKTTCSITTVNGTPGPETCSSWTNNGSATYSGSCQTTVTLPSPDPSNRVQSGPTVSSSTTVGGTSDTLADVAMYYYATDLRTTALNNCSSDAGDDVCENNVFKTDKDSNIAQHMATYTLGMGASGRMSYSPSYLTDSSGDYYSVLKGLTARPSASNMVISVNGSSATLVSSIKLNGVELMSGATTPDATSSGLAAKIAAKITLGGYSASASGSKITISPSSAYTPVITQSGDMILTVGPVCAWQADGTTCNWPIPGDGLMENIDDLWHAAVDGYGTYFSATSPTSLSTGLSNALAAISSRRGAASAAATSTLSPVPGNNFVYFASYTTVKWTGNLEARTIDVTTGQVSQAATWCVENIVAGTCSAPGTIVATTSGGSTVYNCVISDSTLADCPAPSVFDVATSECRTQMATSCTGTMPGKVGPDSDTRTIYTRNSAGTALTNFDAAYAIANPTNFSAAHINTLSQWSSLTATQKTDAAGVNLINFLRGQTGYEDRASNLVGATDNRLYRYREATLGDALESQPMFIGKPVFEYPDPGYSEYAAAQSGRVETVYLGNNDGMLHAFSSNAEGSAAGTERWAYVPSMVIPNMWKLADKDYFDPIKDLHTNFVNGSPIVTEICTANCDDSATAVWRSILVGGLNGGGRGYYALDVTDPTTPSLLWEFTTAEDSDLGYSFGNPVVTSIPDTRPLVPAGTMRWVVLVTSGYNNTSPGDGQGYLYVLDAATGAVINKIGTGVGGSSGLAKISGWNEFPGFNRVNYVYAGDLTGKVWRFDIITADAPLLFAELKDPSGVAQPITTAPVLARVLGKRMIYIGTGKYLEKPDLDDTQVQSVYGIQDDDVTVTLTNPGGSPRNSTTLVQQTLTNQGDGTRNVSSNTVDLSSVRGWYVDFPDSGERVNIRGKLDQGVLVFATTVPSNTACSPGGYSWANFFNFQTGGPVNPDSPIASVYYDNPIVGINLFYVDGEAVWKFVDSGGSINDEGHIGDLGKASGFKGKRVIWRELNP